MNLPPKLAGVYRLRNRFTGAAYIGATNNLRARHSGHFGKLARGASTARIQRSYNQFGKDSMVFEVLLICATEDLSFYEGRAFKVLQPNLNSERGSIEYEVWRNPGAEWQPNLNMKTRRQTAPPKLNSTDKAKHGPTATKAADRVKNRSRRTTPPRSGRAQGGIEMSIVHRIRFIPYVIRLRQSCLTSIPRAIFDCLFN